MSCSSLNKFRLVWIYINRPNNLRWILYEKSNYSYRSLFCKMFVPLKSSFRKKEQHYSTKLPCFFIWSVVNTPYFVYLIKNICNTPHTYTHICKHIHALQKTIFIKHKLSKSEFQVTLPVSSRCPSCQEAGEHRLTWESGSVSSTSPSAHSPHLFHMPFITAV